MIKETWLTQKKVCEELEIDPKTFRKWGCSHVAKKANKKYYQLKDILSAYYQYQINNNLLDDGREKIDKEYEEALNIRETRIGRELKNAIIKGEQAPIEESFAVLADVVSGLDVALTSLPLNIKRHHPEIPMSIVETVENEIIKAQNQMAEIKIKWQ